MFGGRFGLGSGFRFGDRRRFWFRGWLRFRFRRGGRLGCDDGLRLRNGFGCGLGGWLGNGCRRRG
ncbi:MAG: hypothetical protein EBT50_06705, partial [Verrucomicrobia bacterium]|nr:hypothetical protein [Verrucomicrobiota bacterium]